MLPHVAQKQNVHINNRQAPNINAAVPVQTPLYYSDARISSSIPRKEGAGPAKKKRNYSHQPLQSTKFDTLNPLSEPSNFLLNSSLRLLDLKFLALGLLSNPPLL